MIKRTIALIIIGFGIIWGSFYVPLPSYQTPEQLHDFVQKSIDSNQRLATSILAVERNHPAYDQALMYFERESIAQVTIAVTEEITTFADILMSKRRFQLILNKTKQVEYFVTMTVDDKSKLHVGKILVRIQ